MAKMAEAHQKWTDQVEPAIPPQATELNPAAIRGFRRPDTGSSGQGRRGHAARHPASTGTAFRTHTSSRHSSISDGYDPVQVEHRRGRSGSLVRGPGDLWGRSSITSSPTCPATGTPRSPNTSEFSATGTTSPAPRGTAQAVPPDPAQHSQARAPGLPTARAAADDVPETASELRFRTNGFRIQPDLGYRPRCGYKVLRSRCGRVRVEGLEAQGLGDIPLAVLFPSARASPAWLQEGRRYGACREPPRGRAGDVGTGASSHGP